MSGTEQGRTDSYGEGGYGTGGSGAGGYGGGGSGAGGSGTDSYGSGYGQGGDTSGGYGQGGYGPGSYGGGYGSSPQAVGTPPVPPTNAGWAVAAVIFFWPVAFSAFTHSSNVTRLWLMGDYAGAQAASERARSLGRTALFVALGLFVALIVFYVVIIAVLVSTASQIGSSY